jgi:uncharacterized membrane-anchored protein
MGVALAQLFIPAQMIFNQEDILKSGTAYKFKTQPIDPANPFKGKYIRLNYEVNSFLSDDTTWTRQEDVYISITKDSLGFVKAESISREMPPSGTFVKAKVDYYNLYDRTVYFNFPFDEFYMNENKADAAEIVYAEAQNDSLPNNTYALVYLKNGDAVLENVFINDIPIAEYGE